MPALLLVLLLAQETQPSAWSAHRGLADGLSTALVGTNVVGATISAWRMPD